MDSGAAGEEYYFRKTVIFQRLRDSGSSSLANVLNWGILTQPFLILPDVCLDSVSQMETSVSFAAKQHLFSVLGSLSVFA